MIARVVSLLRSLWSNLVRRKRVEQAGADGGHGPENSDHGGHVTLFLLFLATV